MSRLKRRSARQMVVEDVETLPLMNLFVVLIPMLLLSAVFLEMSVIRMNLPSDDAADPPKRESLGLSVAIRDASWIVKGRRVSPLEIERPDDGSTDELRTALAGLSERYPEDKDVVVRSEARTRYDDIVAVMDASRESGFPNISLAGADR